MGIGSINWSKMLNKELDEEFKKKDEVLEELRARKKEELKQNINLSQKNKKMELSEKGNQITAADKEKIAFDEYNLVYSGNVQQIKKYMDQIDDIKLKKQQEVLLGKLVDMNSMWDYDSKFIRNDIYNLFFDWKTGDQKREEQQLDEHQDNASTNEEQEHNAAEQDLAEKKMRAQIKLDQELFEFEERGGFPQVLKDIFNPTDQSSMELDSVYQLKQLCKAFYEKKDNLSQSLVQSLDALANERPWTVKMKKKHFDTSSNNLLTDVEYMRINAERERIKKYQEITKGSAYTYYKILKRLSDDHAKVAKESINNTRETQDPQLKIKLALNESKIKNLLHYMTGKLLTLIFICFQIS